MQTTYQRGQAVTVGRAYSMDGYRPDGWEGAYRVVDDSSPEDLGLMREFSADRLAPEEMYIEVWIARARVLQDRQYLYAHQD